MPLILSISSRSIDFPTDAKKATTQDIKNMINQKFVQPNNLAALQTKVITRDTKHNSFDTGL
jgi:hypothetical protein